MSRTETRTPRRDYERRVYGQVPRLAQAMNAELTNDEIRELARQERLAVKASGKRQRSALIASGDLVPDMPVPSPSLVGRDYSAGYEDGPTGEWERRVPYRVLRLDDRAVRDADMAVRDFHENGNVPDRDVEWYFSVNRWAGFELCERGAE